MGTRLKSGLRSAVAALLCVPAHASTIFNNPYPIGPNPQISATWVFAKPTGETILFEAEPIVRLPFYNDVHAVFLDKEKAWAKSYHLSYRPHLRMYTDGSVPVKMPSYRILPATQHLWLWKAGGRRFRILGANFESGHYSNGQSGCAYGDSDDQDSTCLAIYDGLDDGTDLSRALNRRYGEYSTNMTELTLSYQWGDVETDENRQDRMHSISPRATLFHDRFLGVFDFGGYFPRDIDIYGKWRLGCAYEYSDLLPSKARLQFEADVEWIVGAHAHVNPFRGALTFTWVRPSTMGYYLGLYAGHDNYNLRFVDDLPFQAKLGILWDVSTALEFHHKRIK